MSDLPNPFLPPEDPKHIVEKLKGTVRDDYNVQSSLASFCQLNISYKELHFKNFLKSIPAYGALPARLKGQVWTVLKDLNSEIYDAHYRKLHPEKFSLKPKRPKTVPSVSTSDTLNCEFPHKLFVEYLDNLRARTQDRIKDLQQRLTSIDNLRKTEGSL